MIKGHAARILAGLSLVLLLFTSAPVAGAAPITSTDFQRTWARTDRPVSDGVVHRTWMWGPDGYSEEMRERYDEANGGTRLVQYFDKSRMEVNHDPTIPSDSVWRVTNGLLVVEMMTGQIQVGDQSRESREAARVNVAGDPDDASQVTYWYMGLLRDKPAAAEGQIINQVLTPGASAGLFMSNANYEQYQIYAAQYVPETGHTVAEPFSAFMNSWGTVFMDGGYGESQLFESPFYATGLPVTEAYWATVKLAGNMTTVLVQCFERRCLTYTPSNPSGWEVEAGNVGQHYYRWRYGSSPIETPVDPQPTEPTELSYWYLNPEAAMYKAIGEVCECTPSLGSPFVERRMEEVYAVRHTYNLVTAEPDFFNANTDGYYEWQKQYVRELSKPGESTFIRDNIARVKLQVEWSIFHPESDIGRRIRRIEAGQDKLFARVGVTGPDAYWLYIIQPSIVNTSAGIGLRGAASNKFERLKSEYLSNPGITSDFGDYLAQNGWDLY